MPLSSTSNLPIKQWTLSRQRTGSTNGWPYSKMELVYLLAQRGIKITLSITILFAEPDIYPVIEHGKIGRIPRRPEVFQSICSGEKVLHSNAILRCSGADFLCSNYK